ncbi:MAG: FHA domain-containing protein [Ardenticatenaceae bacterium]
MRRFTDFRPLLLLLLVGLLLFVPQSAVLAQEGRNPSLQITKIDIDNYPDVKVYVDGRNLPSDLADLPITLSENGQEVSIGESAIGVQGTRTAFVLDASGSMQDPGVTGLLRYEEIQAVVERFVLNGYLDPSDWLSIYASDQEGEVFSIHDWTQDHNAVRNELYLYEYPEIGVVTQLFNLIYFALDQFEGGNVPTHLSKSIVLFSDGDGGGSSLKLDDAVNRAINADVVIHTVMLGEGTDETIAGMERIATLTGGKYVQITSDDVVDPIWESLGAQREQRVITYRSQQAQPRELWLTSTLPDGERIQATKDFPAIRMLPVQVEIIEPTGEIALTKQAPAYDTALEELSPKTLNIRANFTWPDNYPRKLTKVEYLINNETKVLTEEPFDQLTFPIENLDTGSYTIRVNASDELGLKGESLPFSFSMKVNRPAAPTPVPPPTPAPATITIYRDISIRQDMARNIVSLIALLLALMAMIIAWRNPARRKQVTEAFGAVVKQVTQPFFPNRDDMKPRPAKAKLTVVQGDGKLPHLIEIRAANTKLGRSPELANIVIDDPRVSRYHCRITEEPNGTFRIWDEGSTSGTFVNFESVDLKAGQMLNEQDLINVGPIQLRFQYASASEEEDFTSPVLSPDLKSDLNGA